jgi:maleate isomerase
MNAPIRLGMLTPSSNTTLEPVVSAMLAALPEVSVHFSRFAVTEIALSAGALHQFDDAQILRAAELLAHAKVHALCWNGTSSGWLGFDADRRLCARLAQATGIAACTSVLALNEIFARTQVRRFGLITPYRDDVQAAIVRNYELAGFACAAERHLSLTDNFSFALVGSERLRAMALEVAAARPDAITIFCTNLNGAALAEELEAQTGIPVYDTIATAVWAALRTAGVDVRRVAGWGRLFRECSWPDNPQQRSP